MKKRTIKHYVAYILGYIQQYLQFQLIALIVTLPILNAWGLPLSAASLIGNMLLTPFLTLFLLCSSSVFFLELLGISSSWALWSLETIAACWNWFMSHAPTWGTTSLPSQPLWILITLPCIAILIAHYTRTQPQWKRLVGFIVILALFFLHAHLCTPVQNGIVHLACNGKTIPLVHHNGTSCLIDTGSLGSKPGTSLEYTLLPQIRKAVGSSEIKHLILIKPGILLFDTVTQLCDIMKITSVHIPYWKDTENSKKLRARFCKMKYHLEQNGIQLIRFGMNSHIVNLNSKCSITLTPLNDWAHRSSVSWKHMRITAHIDKEHRDLYDTNRHSQSRK